MYLTFPNGKTCGLPSNDLFAFGIKVENVNGASAGGESSEGPHCEPHENHAKHSKQPRPNDTSCDHSTEVLPGDNT
jgi:hypothetical protein